MANSPAWIREIRTHCNGPDGQGVIDVFVLVECPTFHLAEGWYWKQCGEDQTLIAFLTEHLPGHLHWERVQAPFRE